MTKINLQRFLSDVIRVARARAAARKARNREAAEAAQRIEAREAQYYLGYFEGAKNRKQRLRP